MPRVHLFTFRMRAFSAAIGTRQGGLAMPLQPFLLPYNIVFGYLISWQRC